MSESRLAALAAISAVMPAVVKFEAGLVRSIAPTVNCVILLSAPVGVHEVSAIAFVQMMLRTKISGSVASASQNGTPKKTWVTQAPTTLRTGTPTYESQSGSSIDLRTSLFSGLGSVALVFLAPSFE